MDTTDTYKDNRRIARQNITSAYPKGIVEKNYVAPPPFQEELVAKSRRSRLEVNNSDTKITSYKLNSKQWSPIDAINFRTVDSH